MPAAKDILYRPVVAWRTFATAERRTASYLLARGFLFRREPAFVDGQKPDFLTSVRGRMWVEVKEFHPPVSQVLLDAGWRELTWRFAKFRGKCRIDVWIAPGFNARVAKQVTHLLSQEMKTGLPDDRELYIAVPSGEFDKDVVRLEWTRANDVNVRLVALRSTDSAYGCPPAADLTDISLIADRSSYVQRQVFMHGTDINVRTHGEGYNPPQ